MNPAGESSRSWYAISARAESFFNRLANAFSSQPSVKHWAWSVARSGASTSEAETMAVTQVSAAGVRRVDANTEASVVHRYPVRPSRAAPPTAHPDAR